MPIDRKRDRVYWILFAVVTVCGLVLPLIYLLLVFSGGTIASQDTGTWKQWWAEHWYTVCTAFRVAVVEPAAGVVAAAVPVLAWRYRFGSFFCAVLPALCYRFLSMLSALLTDSQLLEGTEFAAAVLWSSIIELAVLTAGLSAAIRGALSAAACKASLCALCAGGSVGRLAGHAAQRRADGVIDLLAGDTVRMDAADQTASGLPCLPAAVFRCRMAGQKDCQSRDGKDGG